MKCLLKYQWVKLPRNQMPVGKGVMGAWAQLASRAAFRNGQARYCSYINQVTAGSWAGGIVGLKSILGIKNRKKALETMDRLVQLGYIEYELDPISGPALLWQPGLLPAGNGRGADSPCFL